MDEGSYTHNGLEQRFKGWNEGSGKQSGIRADALQPHARLIHMTVYGLGYKCWVQMHSRRDGGDINKTDRVGMQMYTGRSLGIYT